MVYGIVSWNAGASEWMNSMYSDNSMHACIDDEGFKPYDTITALERWMDDIIDGLINIISSTNTYWPCLKGGRRKKKKKKWKLSIYLSNLGTVPSLSKYVGIFFFFLPNS